MIFEDSFHGVSAAHSAGIPVIMVPDLLQPTEVIQEKTLHVLEFTSSATLFKIINNTPLRSLLMTSKGGFYASIGSVYSRDAE